tara:strand:+ start:8204 stop:8464 length:261 start_codon:yes stop_codon:yes gene_type:complete
MDNRNYENRYIVIGRSSCPYCKLAVDFLEDMVFQHEFLDYVDSTDILEDYKTFYKQDTVPIILSNNIKTGLTRKIGGYSDLMEYMK